MTANKGIGKSIFASIDCPELEEYGCVSEDRVNLQDTDLSNAFKNWCVEKLKEVEEEVEKKEKKKSDERKLEKTAEWMNDALSRIMNKLEIEVTI